MLRLSSTTMLTKGVYSYLFALGACLIILGMLLLVWPELLQYMVSLLFLIAGAACVVMGLRIRQTEKHIRSRVEQVSEVITGTMEDVKDKFKDF